MPMMLLLAIAPSLIWQGAYCLLLCLFLPPVTSQEAEDDLVDFKKAGLSTAQENARKND